MSKGHCYLAQLAAIDVLFKNVKLCDDYLVENQPFFWSP